MTILLNPVKYVIRRNNVVRYYLALFDIVFCFLWVFSMGQLLRLKSKHVTLLLYVCYGYRKRRPQRHWPWHGSLQLEWQILNGPRRHLLREHINDCHGNNNSQSCVPLFVCFTSFYFTFCQISTSAYIIARLLHICTNNNNNLLTLLSYLHYIAQINWDDNYANVTTLSVILFNLVGYCSTTNLCYMFLYRLISLY